MDEYLAWKRRHCHNSSAVKKLETDKEYVIRFTGTKIEYAAITAVSDSDKIQERERPEQTVEERQNAL